MIFEERTLGNVTFRNRILRSSVGGRMCAYDGTVTDVWRNFELKFARGGVGGIISTTFSTNPRRQSPLEYPTISDKKYVRPLKVAIDAIKGEGCRYIVQIGDPGAATQLSLFPEREDELSSSNGFEPLYGYGSFRREMSAQQISKAIFDFEIAAARVQDAGADGVEITAEKGYLIHQFLNPGMNRRKDDWGGSPERRFRLLEEIVKAVRSRVGREYLVGVRIAAADFNYLPYLNFAFRVPWVWPLRHHFLGNSVETTMRYGLRLKELGVDYLHVVNGYGFPNPKGNPGSFPLEEVKLFCNATRHLSWKAAIRAALLNLVPNWIARPIFGLGWSYKEGISLNDALQFRAGTGLPVITNGGYQMRPGMEAALQRGCDFVSMARALIATPDLVDRFKQGLDKPEAPCTFCNRCCARTATSPLGCYELARFKGSEEDMYRQIMELNTP